MADAISVLTNKEPVLASPMKMPSKIKADTATGGSTTTHICISSTAWRTDATSVSKDEMGPEATK